MRVLASAGLGPRPPGILDASRPCLNLLRCNLCHFSSVFDGVFFIEYLAPDSQYLNPGHSRESPSANDAPWVACSLLSVRGWRREGGLCC